MKVFVSLCIIGIICLDAFFEVLAIILGIVRNWEGMGIIYICMALYPIIMYIAYPIAWCRVTINDLSLQLTISRFT